MYRRVLRNLNMGMDLPYNLHTLHIVRMQEKCCHDLLIRNVL